MMQNKIYIEPDLLEFLSEAMQCVAPETIPLKCQCGRVYEMPIIARKSDIQKIQSIIKMANEWCEKNGVYKSALAELLETIKERIEAH